MASDFVNLSHQVNKLHAKIEDIEKSLTQLFNRNEDLTNESGIPSLSYEEQYALDKFKETIIQQPYGRYVVQPMFKTDAVPLKNNYFLANIRYRSIPMNLYPNIVLNTCKEKHYVVVAVTKQWPKGMGPRRCAQRAREWQQQQRIRRLQEAHLTSCQARLQEASLTYSQGDSRGYT